MIVYFDNKTDAAVFAEDLRKNFPETSPLTTTTLQGKFAVCYVSCATTKSSENTEQEQAARFFSQTQVNT